MEYGEYIKYRERTPFPLERASALFLRTDLTPLILDDMYAGEPLVFLTAGDSIDSILDHIPLKRVNDVLLFSPTEYPIQFNPLIGGTVSILLQAVKGVWGYDKIPTPTLDQYLTAGFLTFLNSGTISDVKRMLTDDSFRSRTHIKDTMLSDFWHDFDSMSDKEQRQDTASTLSKLRAILFDPHLRQCLDTHSNHLHIKDKIVLLSFKEREIGRESASLLGALALAQVYSEARTHRTTVYIEGALFGTSILASVMSVAPTFITVQYLDQFPKHFHPELIGSIDQIVASRTSARDAKSLAPEFDLSDRWALSEIPFGRAYHTMGGVTTELHLTPKTYPTTGAREKILERCRR